MLVVDFRTPGSVRGCARFDKQRVAAAMAAGQDGPGELLGDGHLAMTIDQGPETSRYQGLVALEGKDLEHAAHEYFLRSEQIPTKVRIAVGEEVVVGADGARQHWRAGGLIFGFAPYPKRAQRVISTRRRAQGVEPPACCAGMMPGAKAARWSRPCRMMASRSHRVVRVLLYPSCSIAAGAGVPQPQKRRLLMLARWCCRHARELRDDRSHMVEKASSPSPASSAARPQMRRGSRK